MIGAMDTPGIRPFTIKAVNTWGLGLISTNREGTKRYFHFDAVGSTRALTDSSETVTDTYEYNAFGVVESSSGTSVNPYRYVGQYGYYDDGAMGSSSGLLLLGVRYYSPAHGRFWSWDPVPNLNLYAYVNNSATMAVDPSGMLAPWLVGVIVVGVIAGGCALCYRAVVEGVPERLGSWTDKELHCMYGCLLAARCCKVCGHFIWAPGLIKEILDAVFRGTVEWRDLVATEVGAACGLVHCLLPWWVKLLPWTPSSADHCKRCCRGVDRLFGGHSRRRPGVTFAPVSDR